MHPPTHRAALAVRAALKRLIRREYRADERRTLQRKLNSIKQPKPLYNETRRNQKGTKAHS